MSNTLIQAGSSLQLVDEAGALTTLTLPSGIVLRTDLVPRFAAYGRYLIVVNTPNRPITVDALGTVRPLVPLPPSTVLGLTASGSGALTGAYKAKQTMLIRDPFGNVIAESDFGPLMTAATTATAQKLTVTNLNISPDPVDGTRIYRTLAGGEVYFLWRTLEGNTQTSSDTDDTPDLTLSIFTAPTLGSVPDLTLVAEWRGRLWGVDRVDIDTLAYTESGTMYAWSTNNRISVPRVGSDTRGITGLISRRESLVVGRRNNIQQITGTSNSDFRLVKVTDQAGIESQESVATYKETSFFLWKDGVYRLDSNGVACISDSQDGRKGVRSWFTKDDTFNRARFQYAVGMIDPVRLKYRLFLSAAGSSVNDRWVEYDLRDGTWWGPHKTGAFTPVSGMVVSDSNDTQLPMIGSSSGFLWKEQNTATDDVSTAIDFDVDTPFESAGEADTEKHFSELCVEGKVQSAGTVAITPYVGGTDASARIPLQYRMTYGRERLGKLGNGRLLRLNFRHAVAGEPVELYGYEIEDVHALGRR